MADIYYDEIRKKYRSWSEATCYDVRKLGFIGLRIHKKLSEIEELLKDIAANIAYLKPQQDDKDKPCSN